MASNKDRTSHLKTVLHERTKNYCVYDGSGRITDNYEAHADAEDGTPCLRTRYSYVGTTAQIEKRVELEDVWSSTYDMP